jgi:hypothetical protein
VVGVAAGVVAGVVVDGEDAAEVEGAAVDVAAVGGLMLSRFAIGYSAPPMMRFGVAPLVSTPLTVPLTVWPVGELIATWRPM